MSRRIASALALSALLTLGNTAYAAQEIMNDELANRPTAGASVADTAVARPLMLAGTIGGAAIFLASLPFSILGGKVKEAADTLVVGPAKATFTRCLGCTTVQDQRKHENEYALPVETVTEAPPLVSTSVDSSTDTTQVTTVKHSANTTTVVTTTQ